MGIFTSVNKTNMENFNIGSKSKRIDLYTSMLEKPQYKIN